MAARLFWSGEEVSLGRVLAFGALVWLLYGIVIVIASGVILDQDLVPAQIIAGTVHYPPGHPHAYFYSRVFNLPTWLLAGMWALTHNAILASALRNCLFVFLSGFVPFALTAVLTRRPGWAHIASIFAFTETARQFKGIYPSIVFPNFNSDGHMGTYAAVLTIALLLGGFWRWGGFLIALLPAIHPTIAVVVWPWAVCYLVFEARRMSGLERRRLFFSVGAGLAVCAILAGAVFALAPAADRTPPYDSQANGPLIYQTFEATSDAHRQPLPLMSLGYFAQPAALVALFAVLLGTGKQKARAESTSASNASNRRQILWLLALCVIVWSYVFGATALHRLTGWLPSFVQISMPGRFSNLSSLMLIPMSIAILARIRQAPAIFTLLLLIQALVIPVHYDYLRLYLIFVIWGAAFAAGVYLRRREAGQTQTGQNIAPLIAPGVIAAALAVLYLARGELGVFVLAAGFLLFTALLAMPRFALPGWCTPAAWALAVAVSLAMPAGVSWAARKTQENAGYRIEPYDLRLNAWLAANAPAEAILAPMGPPSELQSKTAHPVMMELETVYLMTYLPGLAPVIGSMARDLYGIDYAGRARVAPFTTQGRVVPGSKALLGAWQSRTTEEWRRLGRKYNFRLVLSPAKTPLQIAAVLPGPRWTLYSIQ